MHTDIWSEIPLTLTPAFISVYVFTSVRNFILDRISMRIMYMYIQKWLFSFCIFNIYLNGFLLMFTHLKSVAFKNNIE